MPETIGLSNALDLFYQPLSAANPLYDQVYITGKLSFPAPQHITLDIDDTCPLAYLNTDQIPAEDSNGLTVSDLANNKKPGFSLVSGGLFVTLLKPNGKRWLLGLRRDKNAKSAPGCLTEPAGRMDEDLTCVCVKEANEELIAFIHKDAEINHGVELIIFHSEAGLTAHWNSRKEKQFISYFNGILPGDPRVMPHCLPISKHIPSWANLPESCITLRTPHSTREYTGYAWFDAEHNTLEFRRFVEIRLSPGEFFAFKDGEAFKREPVFVPLPATAPWSMLRKYGPLTPILENLSSRS